MKFIKHLQIKLVALLATATMGVGVIQTANAHPVLINIKEAPELMNVARANLVSFVPEGTSFRKIPFQVDELEDDSLLVIRTPTKEMPVRKKLHHPKSRDPFRSQLSVYHRIVLDERLFQSCDDACTKSAIEAARKFCNSTSPSVFKIDLSYKKSSAFVADCLLPVESSFEKAVSLDTEKRQFSTDQFTLNYSKNSPIIMQELSFKKDNTKIIGASQLEVMVKPKLFLPIHFDQEDMQAEMTSFNETSVSTQMELAVKLKTLGVTTSFEICCDMSVFPDSFYFPVVLDMPFQGSSTREGSGIFFGFNFLGKIPEDIDTQIPPFGGKNASQHNVLMLKTSNNLLAMGVRQPKGLKGEDLSASLIKPSQAKDLGFDVDKSNIGVFMDITKVKNKGVQRFEIWFYTGSANDSDLLKEYAANGVQFRFSRVL